ncbi:MAG: sulfotransferase [Myxococcota bacterium]
MAADIHLDDLAAPILPEAVRALNAVSADEARRRVPLDEASLFAEARETAGLEDFGAAHFREGLGVLLAALEAEAELSLLGRMSARSQIVKLLVNRLRLEAAVARHPEALEVPIERPVVIVGLPRTGTSHLHNLLAGHPELRFLPYWESTEPIAAPGDVAVPGAADPRIARIQAGLDQGMALIPHQQAMHEIDAQTPHEEIGFFSMDFACPIFFTSFKVPSYRAWYRKADIGRSYAYARRVLQVVSFLREGGKRWVLKSPMHLERLVPLMKTYPDARVVLTFRDPARVVLSMATMTAYGRRLVQEKVDPVYIGRQVADNVQDRFDAAVRDIDVVPAAQRCDVHFDAYMKDPIAAVRRVLEFAGLDASDATMARMRAYQEAHPRGKFGRIVYDYAAVGIDPAELRTRARRYIEKFDIAWEAD